MKLKFRMLFIFIMLINTLGAAQITPNRIVSLVPSNTELLFAMGFDTEIVGVSDYCNYPEAAKKIPSVGGLSLNVEKIASLRPSAVIDLNSMHIRYHKFFSKLGINYIDFKIDKLADIPLVALEMAKLLGCPIKGIEFKKYWKKKMALLNVVHLKKPVKVYFEIWDSPKQVAGQGSFINDIIELAGGENVITSSLEYPTVNSEMVAKLAPEIILVAYPLQNIDIIKNRPGWELIPAVVNNRIYRLNQDLFVRPGPRNLEAIALLNKYFSKLRK